MNFDKKYDVVVAGAGIAGVAASLAAAREGYSVALVEKQVQIGGLATSGLIFIYLPLCDGNGKQYLFGIAEELLKISMKYSPCDLPKAWGGPAEGGFHGFEHKDRYQVIFSPAGFIIAMDQALREANVDLWLDTLICATNTDADNKVTSVEVENISGRGRISAKCFVDATGAATLVRQAGGQVNTDTNFQTPWVMEKTPGKNIFSLEPHLGIQSFGSTDSDFAIGNPLDAKVHTMHIREAWASAARHYDESYANGENRHQHYPVILPGMPQLRKIASIAGVQSLGDNDHNKHFEDSIGVYPDWRTAGKLWETPYGTLLPEKISGMLAAGRCMATVGDAWEAFRVIPSAAMTGEAAGCAAALALKKNCDPRELSAEQIRQVLAPKGFIFHF